LEAGKIILIVSLILWFLASYGPQAKMTYAQNQAKKEATFLKLNAMKTKSLIDKYKLENSYAGHLGKFIEPAIAPLGFDWKTGIGIISSFAAREVFRRYHGNYF